MRARTATVILTVILICSAPGAGVCFAEEAPTEGLLANVSLNALEALIDDTAQNPKGRLDLWSRGAASAGPSGTWYSESQSAVWGAGIYAKLQLGEDATVPGLDKLGTITSWAREAGLPVSDPYVLAEPYWIDYTEDAGFVFNTGVGIVIADYILAEYTYGIVDGGQIDTGGGAPHETSGAGLALGLRWEF